MNRLPVYDFRSHRLERAAFVVLNVVGLSLVGLAFWDGARFAAHQGEASPAMVQTSRPALAASNVLTQIGPGRLGRDAQTAGARRLPTPKS